MHPLKLDVRSPDSVKSAFEDIRSDHGRLDFLFNNAGAHAKGVPVDELSFEQWQHVMETNVTGAFLCAQGAFTLMKTQSPMGGRILNNGALSAHSPRPNTVAFTVSKHALLGLTRSLSLDGRAYNIACGQLDLGNTIFTDPPPPPREVRQPDGSMRAEPIMHIDSVTAFITMMAELPLSVNFQQVLLVPSAVPFVGRG